MNTAIIVAAGSSRRMGFDKLFAPLHGKPVVEHSIAAFQQCRNIHEIVLVVRADRLNAFPGMVKGKFDKVVKIVPGGDERHLSVWNGLQAVSAGSEYIAIHDGARPLTTPALIDDCLALAQKEGAACCAAPVSDTVKRVTAEPPAHPRVVDNVERTGLWAMQTPQVFSTAIILQAYAALIKNKETCTDEVSVVQRFGKHIALLRNDDWNFKITVPQDLLLAEQVLKLRESGART